MPEGFIYVLINPAMPALAKVGKTTRNPADRVSELSSATGVPSPFILAYQQPVAECDSAEVWVHRELERCGYRTSNNREFFNAPLHEIVQVVAQAARLVPPDVPQGVSVSPSQDMNLIQASELYEIGYDYLKGTDSVLRNEAKALAYFEQAAALGHGGACSSAAFQYRYGKATPQNLEKALMYFTKAVQLGLWWQEAQVADIFLEAGQKSAAEMHWSKFFDYADEAVKESGLASSGEIIGAYGVLYCKAVVTGKLSHCVPDSTIARLADQISDGVAEELSASRSYVDRVAYVDRLTAVRKFVDDMALGLRLLNNPGAIPVEQRQLMEQKGITYDGEAFLHRGERYGRFKDAVQAAALRESRDRKALKDELRHKLFAKYGVSIAIGTDGKEISPLSNKHPDYDKAVTNYSFVRELQVISKGAD